MDGRWGKCSITRACHLTCHCTRAEKHGQTSQPDQGQSRSKLKVEKNRGSGSFCQELNAQWGSAGQLPEVWRELLEVSFCGWIVAHFGSHLGYDARYKALTRSRS